jgi:hypothetical protein
MTGPADAPKNKAGEGGGGPGPDPAPEPVPAGRTFTQDEVNALVGGVRQEERSKFSDYDETKKKLTDLETANLSDAERREREFSELQRRSSDADERIASIAIESDIKVAAATMGLVDPEAAVLLINRSAISYTEDGGVVGVEPALASLVEAKSYLKGEPQVVAKPNLDPGGGAGEPVTPLTDDQRDAATKMFGHLGPAERDAEYRKGLTAA